uniref:Phosphatase and actin regulator n=2 Tax=Naja naja TaxID=35670 RepID=A0A8C6VIS5_NAJNA
ESSPRKGQTPFMLPHHGVFSFPPPLTLFSLTPFSEEMDQSPAVRSEYLVSGIRTPPVRRNSKLATLGRIFKPWKWRKKKNEKLKQSSTVLEKKTSTRQSRDELIKKGLLEIMEQDSEGKACTADGATRTMLSDPSSPPCQAFTSEEMQQEHRSAITKAASLGEELHSEELREDSGISLSFPLKLKSRLVGWGGNGILPRPPSHTHRTGSKKKIESHHCTAPCLGLASIDPWSETQCCLRFVSSFHGRENKASPKKRMEIRLSRTSSTEHGKEKDGSMSYNSDPENKWNSVKESDENKENLIMDSEIKDDSVFYEDEEVLNDSIISGTLPRKCKKELLAVKLRNRPSKQELEDRNIFPRRTDEERQEIRQQIEMKLSKRLSQRPAVEELERRNILKQRNDQTEQEERREIKQRLTRKLNQRPTVDELRDRKILIRFSDYVEVAKAQDYDRRADKPWTRLSAADKAAIRKELNEYKSNEMEVHASSKHLTRSHRPFLNKR